MVNSGACNVTNGQKSSLGGVSHELQYAEDGSGTPYLTYTEGAVCNSLNTHWNTTIQFNCPNDETENQPKIIENTNCHMIIHFPTKLVCQKEINCKVFDPETNREFDLQPLKSSNQNYLAKINDTLKSMQPSRVLVSRKTLIRFFSSVSLLFHSDLQMRWMLTRFLDIFQRRKYMYRFSCCILILYKMAFSYDAIPKLPQKVKQFSELKMFFASIFVLFLSFFLALIFVVELSIAFSMRCCYLLLLLLFLKSLMWRVQLNMSGRSTYKTHQGPKANRFTFQTTAIWLHLMWMRTTAASNEYQAKEGEI